MALTDALRFTRIPVPSGRFSPGRLLEHWHEALTACLPAPLRHAFTQQDQRLTLIPVGSKGLLCQGHGDARRTIGELDPTSPGGLRAMLSGAKRGRGTTLIELPADRVISRTVSFPVQVRENLVQVVGYEIDRLTPFRPDQLCFDFRQHDEQSKGDKLSVEIAVCRKDQVQDWIERLRNAGAPADQITWDGAWPRANLLPSADRPKRSAKALIASRLLFILVLCLAAAALAGPVWQRTQILENLEQEVAELQTQAKEVYELRDAIELARQGSVAVLERKSEQPRMIELLRELTDRLPDNTWVQNLDFRDGDVQIRGESTQAAALIGLLEKAPGFADVAFRSPIVQVAATGKERFHVSFTYSRADTAP